MKTIKNYIIPILAGIIGVLLYFNFTSSTKLNQLSTLLKESKDTLHIFKTKLGNQGAYISTLEGNKNDLINILSIKDKNDLFNKQIIDSLKTSKDIQTITGVKIINHTVYEKVLDSTKQSIDFEDSVKTKWYDANIKIKNSKLSLGLDTRDELLLTTKLKDNKGLWTGKTLTSYVVSNNPNTDITGVTSVSTKIEQPRIKIRPAIGVGVNSDLSGKNIRAGFNAGIVVTF